mmetsp:Transcript_28797/g.82455  ORF Transcript_28797/g.82455 Transcript_28797/m.82455 type:complete len:316 (+) Transcript_28797:71-1018(+)
MHLRPPTTRLALREKIRPGLLEGGRPPSPAGSELAPGRGLLGLARGGALALDPAAPDLAVREVDLGLGLQRGLPHVGLLRPPQRHLGGAGGRRGQRHGDADVEVAAAAVLGDAALLEAQDLPRGAAGRAVELHLGAVQVGPRGLEAEDGLLHGDPQDGVEVGLRRSVLVPVRAPVRLELHVARELAGRLVADLGHLLQGLALLRALWHPELHGHEDLSAALSALLLALAHADDLAPEGRVRVLRHLDLLRGAAHAVLAVRGIRIGSAAAAENQPRELEALAGGSQHELLRGEGHLDLYGVAPHLRLQLRLHGLLV